MQEREADDAPTRRVSVGLAVFNGEELVANAIEHILAQTYADFELIICDNDSSDRTGEICREFAARDPRIRYYRNPKNIGGVRNENRTYFLACGELFKLAAHDDLIAPDFLERSVAELDRNPRAAVCVPSVVTIDEDGNIVEKDNVIAGLDDEPHRRVRSLSAEDYMCEGTYGLMRVDALRRIRPQSNHMHSDRVMLCELALRHRFAFAEKAVLSKRWHVGNTFVDWRARTAWFQPELKHTGQIRLPYWSQLFDYSTMMLRNRLPAPEWVRCWTEIVRWAVTSWRSFGMDLLYAGRMATTGKAARRRRYATEGRMESTHAYHLAATDHRTTLSALFVVGDRFSPRSDGVSLITELDEAAGRGEDVSVLAVSGDAPACKGFFDRLRRRGYPVMVPRPASGRRWARTAAVVSDVAYFTVSSGADVVRVVSGDDKVTGAARLIGRVMRKRVEDPDLPASAESVRTLA
jgi:glycosyltransferase involved in cell wall biosynthesis